MMTTFILLGDFPVRSLPQVEFSLRTLLFSAIPKVWRTPVNDSRKASGAPGTLATAHAARDDAVRVLEWALVAQAVRIIGISRALAGATGERSEEAYLSSYLLRPNKTTGCFTLVCWACIVFRWVTAQNRQGYDKPRTEHS